jgi:P-type Ca2+ transporter type 2C
VKMEMTSIAEGPSQDLLDSLNVEQAREENKANLDKLGGIEALAKMLNVDLKTGVKHSQVLGLREKYGNNQFPESPMATYWDLLIAALSDTTLLILVAAATVSLIIGVFENPAEGWIEGAAIFVAVALVANISAGNDYAKELQFRKLEATSAEDERTSVFREGTIERINPMDIVVGDVLVLQAGDAIAADCIMFDDSKITSSEAALTGEPEDMKKSKDKDPFLLSSCLITTADETRAMVVGIGTHSQWGKIKASLVMESVNTPLQDKLEVMTENIGYVGMAAAVLTFTALVINIWAIHHGEEVLHGFISAFIQGVVIVVVAIPEGLPLAVTIALSYSTSKMYQDQCFIRVLAACETMGNATNICSDKTGTLTENRMTVVAGWYADNKFTQESFKEHKLSAPVTKIIAEHACISRTAYLVYNDSEGNPLPAPSVIGNKTEGALLMLAKKWGYNDENTRSENFNDKKDKVFAFNSSKKRSSTIVHRKDGSITVFCKGASEWVIQDCTHFTDPDGNVKPLTDEKRKELEEFINSMAVQALRTLTLTHKNYASGAADLPSDYMENPPDHSDLVLDCIVGIIDPLRGDVVEAVRIAQGAGVTVRMVTGDNLATAKAIARQCGIYKDGNGIGIEGPDLRKMTPAELDKILPVLQVVGRSSPDDKYLLVTRLNGHGVPANQADWEAKHKDKTGVTWDTHKDKLLPGYREEWEATRPGGGQVVGVTGDGTNDAPALKAADVGLAMGITGTKVAQAASDIVILDDRFSSIVRAIMWGRSIYDNIRKFLQFQLTVNVVALLLVFIGAVAGFGEPLNAVQMLWVNLVMDTLGALALATEPPTMKLLERKPYKRQVALVSYPLWRNILAQSLYQIIVLLVLLFAGGDIFDVPVAEEGCHSFKVIGGVDKQWSALTNRKTSGVSSSDADYITCSSFATYCAGSMNTECFEHQFPVPSDSTRTFKFEGLKDFLTDCLECKHIDRRHGTIIFNAFIFCQFFNLFNSRILFSDRLNPFYDLAESGTFLGVAFFILGFQVLLVNFAGEFMKIEPLSGTQWLVTIIIGVVTIPLAMITRFIPVEESPDDFFDNSESINAVVPVEATRGKEV